MGGGGVTGMEHSTWLKKLQIKSKRFKALLIVLYVEISGLMYRYKLTEYRTNGSITFLVIAEENWISVGLAWQGSCV
jgi:hypothetical protein